MICSSFAFPNMFDVARNKVSLYNNEKSLTNRIKLLILSDPTEMHMNPRFGVGIRKYLYRYNNDNTLALIRDNIIDQLKMWEPGVIAEETKVTRGIQGDGVANNLSPDLDLNHLKITVTVTTSYNDIISLEIDRSDFESSFI